MGFSAFLVPPMAKEKDRVELRPVDEGTEKDSRLYRLHKDAVEEVDDSPPVRVGQKIVPEARLEALDKDGLKIRSVEPGVASLIERNAEEQARLESEWEGPLRPGWCRGVGWL